jgi:NAD-dependent deacetylase
MKDLIATAARILHHARHPIFLSGAGISAESGIPTFRGSEGLWKNYRAEELATPEAFARDPHLVWQWYNWRKERIAQCKPNPAHYAAAELKKLLPQLLCVTQNVDGFHALAGLSEVLEMHGNIYRTRCLSCKTVEENRTEITPTTPCPACGKVPLRPDVVWFGETLPRQVMDVIYARLQIADAILVVGTSGTVYPAAGFAVEVRRRRGTVIEINTDAAHRPYADDIYLHGKAGEILPAIVDELRRLS